MEDEIDGDGDFPDGFPQRQRSLPRCVLKLGQIEMRIFREMRIRDVDEAQQRLVHRLSVPAAAFHHRFGSTAKLWRRMAVKPALRETTLKPGRAAISNCSSLSPGSERKVCQLETALQ